jgi:uncharacterized protein YcaQ
MADGKQWTTANLNLVIAASYCSDDADLNCRRYGRLYTWEAAGRVCQQWRSRLKDALARARARLAHAGAGGTTWYWPADAALPRDAPGARVRLLTPFDPLVWDRRRFELLWGWTYRFEAYTPVRQRKLGYYALPLLYRDEVIGWGNVLSEDGGLSAQFGYAGRRPRDRAFARELDRELERLHLFLGR